MQKYSATTSFEYPVVICCISTPLYAYITLFMILIALIAYSPMDVNYRWSFLVGDTPCIERRQRIIPAQTYVVVDDDEMAPQEHREEPQNVAEDEERASPEMVSL